MKLINADEFRRRAREFYPEYWEEVLDEMPAVEVPDLTDMNVEKFTDEEKRIFLVMIGREEKLCQSIEKACSALNLTSDEAVDLVKVCREIKRKVKKSLWTED